MAGRHDGDVLAFDERADEYETGGVGRWHARIAERSADVALAAAPIPLRMLDVGCGTGLLLRELAVRVPTGEEFVGVDPAPRMLAAARRASDDRLSYVCAAVEALPFPDGHFDLVVSSTSFDHWADQPRGLAELARVVSRRGTVVIVDLAAAWLPRKGRARTPRLVTQLLTGAGLELRKRETVYRLGYLVPFVRAFVAGP
jgi:ubiquinone/menaquinone biosynthesis C-methylase UbiE